MEKDKKNKPTSRFAKIKQFLLGSRKRTVIILIFILLAGFFIFKSGFGQVKTPTYQTAQVTKGTIVSSVAESGLVSVANRASITTQASGVVSQVYVKNGDQVEEGQKIADISLDPDGLQRQAQALTSYLSAQNGLNNARAQLYSLQSSMFSKWKTYTDLAENSTYQNADGTANTANRTLTPFTTAQDDWLAAEASYKNQQGQIAQSQSNLTSAWLNYQAASSVITAPMAGTISDITIVPGMQLNTSYSGNNVSSQIVASIKKSGNPVVTVSLSEVDAASVKTGDKATLTFDAFPNQTFTGKVLGINTTGSVNSGVTTYPAIIQLDTPNNDILPNMSATANIITAVKNDVLKVPSTAVQSNNGQSTVRVLKNGQISTVDVQTGLTSDSETEITSGLSEEDTVVTSFITSGQGASGSSSPFNRTGFGGGGGVRFIGGGR
ncbi:MAG: efflux RND transporter periplasmic adaptor subunit [Patescibacteria group bacterium]|nr:efflux RND transporter periplasmic adaptor subunit [Patescibacteria group bacterium]